MSSSPSDASGAASAREPRKRILLVEDNPDDFELLRGLLGKPAPFDIEHQSSLADAVARLAAGGIDAVILDLGLPDSRGMETFARARAAAPELPVLVLTGLDDERMAMTAVQSGAQDYLVKGRLVRSELVRAVRHAIERQRLVSELRQVSADLQASEARFRFLVQDSSDVIWMLAADAAVRDVNPAAERVLGEQPSVLLGSSLLARTHPADAAALEQGIAEALRRPGESRPVEFRLRASDGTWRVLETAIRAALDPWGHQGLVANSRDVTRERLAARRLAVQDETVRILSESASLADAAPRLLEAIGGNLGWDLGCLWARGDGKEALRCLTVWPAPPAGGQPPEAVPSFAPLPLDGGGPARAWRERRLVQGRADDEPGRALAAAGLRVVVSFPLLDGDDVPFVIELFRRTDEAPDKELAPTLAVVATDVAHFLTRRRAEAERRASAERLRRQAEFIAALASSMGEGVCALDRHGRATFLNPAAARLLGWSEEELRHRDAHRALHARGEDGAACGDPDCPILSVIGSGAVSRRDDELFARKDGSRFPVSYTSSPLIEGGENTGVVVVFQDISERRQLESQLRQAQKMEAVGRLAAGVAHDFNNMLGVIVGSAELLLAQTGDDRLRSGLAEIGRAAQRATALTAQLLAFGRKQIVRPRLVDLNRVVDDMRSLLARALGEDIEVVTQLEPGLAQVKVDPGQIEQVIMTLAVNARDAMPRGGKLLIETRNAAGEGAHGRTHPELATGEHALLLISDTGTGMDADTLSHVFEPFFTTKEPGQGTGLGLATVYALIKGAGGSIWVDSKPGRGSTFSISLPRVEGRPEARAARAPAAAVPGGETILLVEDEPALRHLLGEMLAMKGYRVVSAPGPEEALRLAREHPERIDLVVTDVVMPGMNGREMMERLAPLRPGLPVLYISGYTDDAVFRQGLLEPGSHFMPKPFTPTELWKCVRGVLDAGR